MSGYISRDGGHPWITGQIISEKSGGDWDSAVLPYKTILTLSENVRNSERPSSLLLARFNRECLLANKTPEPRSSRG